MALKLRSYTIGQYSVGTTVVELDPTRTKALRLAEIVALPFPGYDKYVLRIIASVDPKEVGKTLYVTTSEFEKNWIRYATAVATGITMPWPEKEVKIEREPLDPELIEVGKKISPIDKPEVCAVVIEANKEEWEAVIKYLAPKEMAGQTQAIDFWDLAMDWTFDVTPECAKMTPWIFEAIKPGMRITKVADRRICAGIIAVNHEERTVTISYILPEEMAGTIETLTEDEIMTFWTPEVTRECAEYTIVLTPEEKIKPA